MSNVFNRICDAMGKSETQTGQKFDGEVFHKMSNVLWRRHAVVCEEMHAETQMKRKMELANKADWIWDAIDAADAFYEKGLPTYL